MRVAACRGPRLSCQATARGFADDMGAWGLRGSADWPSVAGPCVCAQISHTPRVCVCPRACSSASLQADSGFRGGRRAESALSATTWAVCDPVDSSPPVLSVPGILQTRMLEWVSILQGICPHPEIEPRFSHNAGRFFTF